MSFRHLIFSKNARTKIGLSRVSELEKNVYSGFWHIHKHKLANFPLHTLMIIVFHYLLIPVNNVASRDHSKSKVDKILTHV